MACAFWSMAKNYSAKATKCTDITFQVANWSWSSYKYKRNKESKWQRKKERERKKARAHKPLPHWKPKEQRTSKERMSARFGSGITYLSISFFFCPGNDSLSWATIIYLKETDTFHMALIMVACLCVCVCVNNISTNFACEPSLLS